MNYTEPSALAQRICRRFYDKDHGPLWKVIDEEVAKGGEAKATLTPAQMLLLSGIMDGQWHTYGGRKTAMINRLGDVGVVQFRYHPRGPGMPERIDARLTPAGEAPGHVAFER